MAANNPGVLATRTATAVRQATKRSQGRVICVPGNLGDRRAATHFRLSYSMSAKGVKQIQLLSAKGGRQLELAGRSADATAAGTEIGVTLPIRVVPRVPLRPFAERNMGDISLGCAYLYWVATGDCSRHRLGGSL